MNMLLFTEIGNFTFIALIISHEVFGPKVMLLRRRREILRFEFTKFLSQQ